MNTTSKKPAPGYAACKCGRPGVIGYKGKHYCLRDLPERAWPVLERALVEYSR